MEKEIELLPCPFCGGRAEFGTMRYSESAVRQQKLKQNEFYMVVCIVCGGSTQQITGEKTQRDAADQWNTRTATAREARLVDALEEVLTIHANAGPDCPNEQANLVNLCECCGVISRMQEAVTASLAEYRGEKANTEEKPDDD